MAPGEWLLILAGALALAHGALLALLPADYVADDRSRVVLYAMAPRPAWALAWIVMAVPPLWAVRRPTLRARQWAWRLLIPAGTAWTAGLTAPMVLHLVRPDRWPVPNLFAPVVWAVLVLGGLVISRGKVLASPFYRDGRPLVRRRNG